MIISADWGYDFQCSNRAVQKAYIQFDEAIVFWLIC